MFIQDENYRIWYEETACTVHFSGSLRLADMSGYQKIRQYLCDLYSLDTPCLTLDFTELQFLNSSGISALCRFVFEVMELKPKKVTIIGNRSILWQSKSFENLRKIWDNIVLDLR